MPTRSRNPLLLACLLPGLLFGQAAQTLAQVTFEPLVAVMNEELTRSKLPSVSVTLMHQGEVVFDHALGFADRDRQRKATTDTAYSLASVSKTFTVTALMKLVGEGAIDLDVPIDDYLGKQKLTVHLGEPGDVTVRRVADHTAGLPMHYNFFYATDAFKRPPMDESIRKFGHVVTPPGERYNYSNFGYGLLDYIIERTSGQSYGEYLASVFFRPLGMRNSATSSTLDRLEDVAVPYGPDDLALAPYDFDHRGASAVFASTSDLAKFGRWFLDNTSGEDESLPGRSPREEMVRVDPIPYENGDQTYGLGINVRREFGRVIYSHSGNMPGVSATLTLLPDENFVIAIGINSSAPGALPALSRVRDSAIALLIGNELPGPSAPSPGLPDPVAGVPDELVGAWSGAIHTDSGVLPLNLVVSSDGRISGVSDDEVTHGYAYYGERGGFHVLATRTQPLTTPDAARYPHATMLSLVVRDDHLNGSATAFGDNAVSYWVDLTRDEESHE